MKKVLTAVGLLFAAGTGVAETTAFVNVNVVPMSSEIVLRNVTLIVDDGSIEAIGTVADTPVPQNARVVDGTDRYLMPGLAEMHGHVPDTMSESLERVFALFLVNGVTTVRGMLGQPSHLALRSAIAGGEVLGPRLFTSGPSFNGRSVDDPGHAERMVREQAQAGYDFLKIHPGLSDREFAVIADTARLLGIPFAGHVPADVGVPMALDAGIATIDHLDGYMETLVPAHVDPSGGYGGFFGVLLAAVAEPSRIEPIARATAAANVWNVPTEALFEHVLSSIPAEVIAAWPEMQYMPAETVAQWRESKEEIRAEIAREPDLAERAIALRRQLIVALHAAGAGLLLGSDSPQIFNVPGFAIHRELGYLVDAGLTPYEALRTGTVNPAVYFGQPGRFGTIAEGVDADLVLLDDNPLEDIASTRRIHGVMVRGRWLDRGELDGMLERLRPDRAPTGP
jgi:imidazolonepropionase-like amidohydrolase